MRIQKIYIDTSVLGGYFETEFEIRSPKDLADYENE